MPPNEIISASSGTAQDRSCGDGRFTPITRDSLLRIGCRYCEQWFVGSGLGRSQSPNHLEGNRIPLEAIWQRMGPHSFSTFNRWQKVWVGGFLQKEHWSIIPEQNHFKQLQDRTLHLETVVAHFMETVDIWLHLENFDNTKWIQWWWVAMFLKKCGSEVQEARRKGRQGHKRLATDFGDPAGNNARAILAELPNSSFLVVIHRVPNGNKEQTSSNRLQASYTDVTHWEELIDSFENEICPREPYCLTVIY